MLSFLLVIFAVAGPGTVGFVMCPSSVRFRIARALFFASISFLMLVVIVNGNLPFTTAGDDLEYFRASQRQFDDFADWFNLQQFSRTHEQGGYPLLLSWVHQFAGGSIFHRKLLNVVMFLFLSLVWFEIGRIVGGQKVATAFAYASLFATPLWFYWLFLFKDMAIVLLQSLMILGLVCFLTPGQRLKGYMLLAVSTLVTIPFRSLLAVVNVAVLAMAALLRAGRRRSIWITIGQVFLAATVIALVLLLGAKPELLAKLGVVGEYRTLDAVSIERAVAFGDKLRADYFYNPFKYLMVFLVGEVAAFNPQSWTGDSSQLLRASLMVPWIYIGLPFFLRGVWNLTRARRSHSTIARLTRPDTITIERSYILLLLGFVALYAAIGWLIGDTTRWRMPSFPPMIAIAALAWLSMSVQQRVNWLALWGGGLTVSVLAYYVLLK